jgi:hypothetical protein
VLYGILCDVFYRIVLYFTVLYCTVLHCNTLPPGMKPLAVDDDDNNNNNNFVQFS